jgi:hypothetical protein
MTAKFDFGSLGQPFEATWPVRVPVPQDGGTVVTQEFLARFRLLSSQQEEEAKTSEDPDAFFRAFWIGLGGEAAEEFTPDLVALMLGRVYVRRALLNAYYEFVSGTPAKN